MRFYSRDSLANAAFRLFVSFVLLPLPGQKRREENCFSSRC
jgi:hypothetical protein